MFFLALFACVRTDTFPDVGACASYPEGDYEYGEIGIGSCIAGPSSMQWIGDGTTLAVVNANPWLVFTGGSLLTLDIDNVDPGAGRNLISDLDPSVLALPSFSGASALAEPYGAMLIANRLSDGGRTREEVDRIWFADVSSPTSPALSSEIGPDENGAAIDVGYDPNEVVYDPTTDRAFTIDRTSHTVVVIDLASRPARLVPPGGDGRLTPDDFVDADASGSRAAFATLETVAADGIVADQWTLTWAAATVRAWLPTEAGLYRETGNGERTWVRSAMPVDVDLEDAEGEVLTTRDPAWVEGEGGYSRLLFVDETGIRAADETGNGEDWLFETDPLLAPTADEPVLADPFAVHADGIWSLFYSDGQSILVATSFDGFSFDRAGGAVFVEGSAATDPTVLYDGQLDRWRMWFNLTAADGTVSLGQAWSDDLIDWTVEADAVAGYASSTVAWWSGAFHCFYAGDDGAGATAILEAVSPNGDEWTDVGVALMPEAGAFPEDGVALQPVDESAFRMENIDGEVFPYALYPGVRYVSDEQGWVVQPVAGHLAGPEDAPEYGAYGLSMSSRIGELAWFDMVGDDGVSRIGAGTLDASGITIAAEPALSPYGDGFASEGLANAVVMETPAGYVMFFGATGPDITSIGRATSSDGIRWTAEKGAVYEGVESFESFVVTPGSVQVLDDGTIRLWYSASDGSTWRIGLLESADDGESFQRVDGELYDWAFDGETPGSWDDSGVRDPWVVRDGEIDRMWFSGFDGNLWQVGYAERGIDQTEWTSSVNADGDPRPVVEAIAGGPGIEGVSRPVVTATASGWELYMAAVDGEVPRVTLGIGREADRVHRVLPFPTLADEWGFTVVPPNDAEAISLDFYIGSAYFTGRGCGTLALDETAGMLYVGCTLVPVVYALDVRDDSTSTFDDLNYLGVESVLLIQTSTGSDSGLRDILVDAESGRLWGIGDEPEAVYELRTDDLVDDATTDVLRDRVLGLIALPRALERDEGVDTRATIGPGQMALHPDGQHLFVTNFNDNSLSVIDLLRGPLGTLVSTTQAIGENPYALLLTPDGSRAVVANYTGELTEQVSSTLVILDTDPESEEFMQPLTWVVNQ